MAMSQSLQMQTFDLLPPPAQKRLHARIEETDGGRAAVEQDIRVQLERLDNKPEPAKTGARVRYQGERAFLVAQLTYLSMLGESDSAGDTTTSGRLGWWRSRSTRAQD
jgi:hypothetical protein